MGRIDKLVERYKRHIALPWQKDLAGAQRTIFIQYDRTDERRLRARMTHLRAGDQGGRARLDRVQPDRCLRRVDGQPWSIGRATSSLLKTWSSSLTTNSWRMWPDLYAKN